MADFRLRIQFAKEGTALWLSHLEVVRAMERLIRRSGLPYAISQGFNPHLKHSFSAALPVGTSSWGEYMDVELAELVAPEEALAVLQATQHNDLPVLSAAYVSKDEPSLQMYFNLASYLLSFEDPDGSLAPELQRRLQTIKEVDIEKKGKLKTYEVARFLTASGLIELPEPKAPVSSLAMTMLSWPDGALRPEVLLAAVAASDFTITLTSLIRTNLEHKEL